MRALPLTFPATRYKGRLIALACAGGVKLRYELTQIARGSWSLTIEANGRPSSHPFTSQRAAAKFARDDFRRRQLLRRVV